MDWCFCSFPILVLLHCCCCFSLNVTSTCNAPLKMNYFLLQVLPTHYYAIGKPYPDVFDLSAPPLMFSLLLSCCQSSTKLPLLLWCCCSLFHVAVPAFMLPPYLDVAIPPSILPFFLWCSCYSSMLLLPHWGCLSTFNVPKNLIPGSSIWDQRSGV